MKKSKQAEKMMSQLEGIKVWLEELAQVKQDNFDNKSERWQEGDKGQDESDLISEIEDAANDADSLYGKLEDIFSE